MKEIVIIAFNEKMEVGAAMLLDGSGVVFQFKLLVWDSKDLPHVGEIAKATLSCGNTADYVCPLS